MTPVFNPNGPPPKFPQSKLNPGPETRQDWERLIRWLLLFWQRFQTASQSTECIQGFPTAGAVLAPRRITFVFDMMTVAGAQTSNLRIQFPAEAVPIAVDLAVNSAPQGGAALFDIQTSPDRVNWSTILTTPLSVPQGATGIATVTTFAAGAKITPGSWIRAVIANGSDLTAQQAVIQLEVA